MHLFTYLGFLWRMKVGFTCCEMKLERGYLVGLFFIKKKKYLSFVVITLQKLKSKRIDFHHIFEVLSKTCLVHISIIQR